MLLNDHIEKQTANFQSLWIIMGKTITTHRKVEASAEIAQSNTELEYRDSSWLFYPKQNNWIHEVSRLE